MTERLGGLCRSIYAAALGLWLVAMPGLSQEIPRNLVVVQSAEGASTSQVQLRWDPVPGALGYEVLRKRNGSWWLNEDDPNCTPMTHSTSITGLTPDTEFVFCVRAVLAKGLSATGAPVVTRTAPLGTAAVVRKEVSTRPLPVVDDPQPPTSPPPVPREPPMRNSEPDPIPLTGSITDLVPAPPPRPKATPVTNPASNPSAPAAPARSERPKGPPPPVPEGLMGLFTGTGDIRLSWRAVAEATGYLVEEEREGQWVNLEDGVIQENRPSLVVKGRSGAGPYYFRVRAIRAGVRSSFSLPTKVER